MKTTKKRFDTLYWWGTNDFVNNNLIILIIETLLKSSEINLELENTIIGKENLTALQFVMKANYPEKYKLYLAGRLIECGANVNKLPAKDRELFKNNIMIRNTQEAFNDDYYFGFFHPKDDLIKIITSYAIEPKVTPK